MISVVRRTLLFLCLGPVIVVALHVAIFRVLPVPLTPLMVIRWTQDHPIDKDWVDLTEISPHVARAVIAAEDNRFCEHTGVDWSAVKTVVNEYREEGRLRGASTVSMQTAKNLYLWPGRSVVRKALEAGLVHVLEWAWTKERIMEVYLNIGAGGGTGLDFAGSAGPRSDSKKQSDGHAGSTDPPNDIQSWAAA
jgi:monofunctional biosynthetic peptidoglycan transglycosylase